MSMNFPSSLLSNHNNNSNIKEYEKSLPEFKQKLELAISEYNLCSEIISCSVNPISYVFVLRQLSGSQFKTFKSFKTELEVKLGRFIEIYPNLEEEGTFCVAVKHLNRGIVNLKNIFESEYFQNSDAQIPMAIGMDMLGRNVCMDLCKAPHILIGGTTGSGKSVLLDDIILSILMKQSPDDVKLLLIDTKKVNFKPYDGIPHLLCQVLTNAGRAFDVLAWIEDEMLKRLDKFEETHVKNIDQYNEKYEKMYRIVIIIDEYSDMIADADNELNIIIQRIAQTGRIVGIHLIVATQLTVSKVITSDIKANLPFRISLAMIDKREIRAIVDQTGTPKLLGSGDLLVSASEDAGYTHIQAAYVNTDEILKIIEYLKIDSLISQKL